MLEHLFNYTNGACTFSISLSINRGGPKISLSASTDHTILRDEILNITTAGRGKVHGALLTFKVCMLAGHLDLLAKLRKEILRFGGPTVRPTFDDCRPMKYLGVRSISP
ncbi:hypothetical protein K438DRAFT_1866721 [Mycena galopus ATCC 62051]|nr:hypothetical protein K438DRAFT_1866721 [Mycena galopus ATCC 62051]